ncbi:MOSC domain-containing protein [Natronosporangium hydrolyticum]|uniref:MOSC domain-containing protein n=1 Tax=Natronosporangium hydrolyticum TaxID=2811111 RepID=A0A895YF84_9ACTN|nr:MOSC domain-containing protein [Natronosporangium hydrolyticum]QSB16524.1 MOSC domain-containing protein [Natronosporangium hydrolyticum]
MHLDLATLEAALPQLRQAPGDHGRLEMIVRRPDIDEREVVAEADLDPSAGLVGDSWQQRGTPDPERQLTLMNSRAVALLAGSPERWPLAGDQLYVELDLSADNVPAGTRLAIGEAVVEVTAAPHRGCKKFAARYGLDALRFVNSETGYALKLRGVNAKVVTAGTIRTGDPVTKVG